jgi:pimeloyl-ACP methyl ester carboxylesterase
MRSILSSRLSLLWGLLLSGAAVLSSFAHAAPGISYRVIEGEGGVPLNVASTGDPAKPAILLVHGIGQSHVSFEAQLRAPLSDEFHVVSFDLRGHGNSGKPWEPEAYKESARWAGDVRRVMEALGLKRPVLLGWSYGTMVVSDYLRRYGTDNLAGIVLVGAYGGLTPPPGAAPPGVAEQMARNRALQWSADPAENAAAAATTAAMLTARDMGEASRTRAAQIAMMLPAYARRHMFDRSLANMDLIARIDVPVLLNVATKDLSTPEAPARELAAKLAAQGVRAEISVYVDVGHSPFVEAPERFNQEFAAFVRKAQVGTAGKNPPRDQRPAPNAAAAAVL